MHARNDEDQVCAALSAELFRNWGFSDHSPWKYHTDFLVSDIMQCCQRNSLEYVEESIRALERKYRNRISISEWDWMRIFSPNIVGKKSILEYHKTILWNHHYHTDDLKSFHTWHHTTNRGCSTLYGRKAYWRNGERIIRCLSGSIFSRPLYALLSELLIHIAPALAATSAGLRVMTEHPAGNTMPVIRSPMEAQSSNDLSQSI